VTVKAAWIGVGGLVAATVLAWALGWIGPKTSEANGQQATATDGNAVNVSGSNNEVSVGGTTLEVSGVWSGAEQRELQRALNRIKQAIESHDWKKLDEFLSADQTESKRAIGIDLPQLIEEEVLGLGYEHNNLGDADGELDGFARLERIEHAEFRGIDTSRRGVAVITGSVTLEGGGRRDVSFELELVNGAFRFILADG